MPLEVNKEADIYPSKYVGYVTTFNYSRHEGNRIPENVFVLGSTNINKFNVYSRCIVLCKITQLPFKQSTKPPDTLIELSKIIPNESHFAPMENANLVFNKEDDIYRYEYSYMIIPINTYDFRNVNVVPEKNPAYMYHTMLIDMCISINGFLEVNNSKPNTIYDIANIHIKNNVNTIHIKTPYFTLTEDRLKDLWSSCNNEFILSGVKNYWSVSTQELNVNKILFGIPGHGYSMNIQTACTYRSSGNPIYVSCLSKHTHSQYGKHVDLANFTYMEVINPTYFTDVKKTELPSLQNAGMVSIYNYEQLDCLNTLLEFSRPIKNFYDNFKCGYSYLKSGSVVLSFYIKQDWVQQYIDNDLKNLETGTYEAIRLGLYNVTKIGQITGFTDHKNIDSLIETDIYDPKTGHYYPPLETNAIEARFASFDLVKKHITGQPFSYQKRNIVWLDEFESNVRKDGVKLVTKYVSLCNQISINHYRLLQDKEFEICGLKRHLISAESNSNKGIICCSTDQFIRDIRYTGGILADNVGLGKTFSFICHLVNQMNNDKLHAGTYDLNTLVIVPPRLLKQWKYEIDKYVINDALTVTTIGSITDIKKMYKKNLKFDCRVDVYIMSSNILNNKNYMSYIYTNWMMNPDEKYNIDNYFDIFRIKWNRVILDEAHERIFTIADWTANANSNDKACNKADREMSINIIFNIQSNYRWGMTATPFENKANNLFGYMLWLSKDYKTNMADLDVIKELYGNELKKLNDTSHEYYKIINQLPTFLLQDEVVEFQKLILSKTTKKLVSGEINIPIFTEEIKMLDLTNIETNIYNNAKTDSTFSERRASDRIKRLFQLCTNICISSYDLHAMGLSEDKIISLEDLNKAMVVHFGKQLELAKQNLDELQTEIPLIEEKKKLSIEMVGHLENYYTEINQISYNDKRRLRNMIESAFAHDSERYGNFVATEVEQIALKALRKLMYRRLLECSDGNFDNILSIGSNILDDLGTRPDWTEHEVIYIIYHFICTYANRAENSIKSFQEQIAKTNREVVRLTNQIKLFENNDFIKEKTADPCTICWMEYTDASRIVVTDCRHIMCGDCFAALASNKRTINCPECREDINTGTVKITTMSELHGKKSEEPNIINPAVDENWRADCISKYGTKMATLIEYLQGIFADPEKNNRAIVFSQYDTMLKLIGRTLDEYGIRHVYCRGNVHVVNKNIDSFKRDQSIRVIMLSSEHSNSGSNLTEASHIVLVDVLNMDADQTKAVESQAIGRAVRLGQNKPVKVVRLITKNTIENEYYDKNKYDVASIQ